MGKNSIDSMKYQINFKDCPFDKMKDSLFSENSMEDFCKIDKKVKKFELIEKVDDNCKIY